MRVCPAAVGTAANGTQTVINAKSMDCDKIIGEINAVSSQLDFDVLAKSVGLKGVKLQSNN